VNELLKKKSGEVIELKTTVHNFESLKCDYNGSLMTIEQLNETVKQKNRELAENKETIFSLEQKVRDFSYEPQSINSSKLPRHISEELESLRENLRKK